MSLYLGNTPIAVNSSSRNIGEIIQSTIPMTDAGLHLLDGSLISGSGSYADFVTYMASLVSSSPDCFCSEADWQTAITTYGVCGKFVYDSINNTVRLPKITGFTEGTIDPTVLGDLTEAGLPNITGATGLSLGGSSINLLNGAFYVDSNGSGILGTSDSSSYRNIKYDASRSSSIYGNSLTVQPQAIKVLYYIVIATSTKTQIEVDIDEIATDLNGKADVDLSNMNPTQTVKNTIVGWGMPDYTAEVNLGEPTTYQTLPCDCYVYYTADTGSSTSSQGFYYANSDESYKGVFRQTLTYNRIGLGMFLPKGWKVKRFDSSSTIHYAPLKGVLNA